MDLLCVFFSVLCLLCLCARLFVCALWSLAGKGLTSWLSFVVSGCGFVAFPSGILGQTWYLFVSIPDLCTLTYFDREGWTIVEKTNHRRLQTNEGTDCIKEKRRNNTHREVWTIIEKLTTGACRLMKEWT